MLFLPLGLQVADFREQLLGCAGVSNDRIEEFSCGECLFCSLLVAESCLFGCLLCLLQPFLPSAVANRGLRCNPGCALGGKSQPTSAGKGCCICILQNGHTQKAHNLCSCNPLAALQPTYLGVSAKASLVRKLAEHALGSHTRL